MGAIGFAERLAYVRWLRSRGRIRPETDTELAASLGVGAKWLGKWKGKSSAPEGRTEATAIAAALSGIGVTLDWLYDGKGSPPEPSAWKGWLKDWERSAVSGLAAAHNTTVEPEKSAAAFAAKQKPATKQAAGQRGRKPK